MIDPQAIIPGTRVLVGVSEGLERGLWKGYASYWDFKIQHFPYTVEMTGIDFEKYGYIKPSKWCDDNISDYWCYSFEKNEHNMIFNFSRASDAVAFKLRWG